MAFDEQRLRNLLQLFANDSASKDEIKEVVMLLREQGDDEVDAVDWERIWNEIHMTSIGSTTPLRKIKWSRVAVAAAIIISMGMSAYFLTNTRQQNAHQKITSTNVQRTEVDVQPGGNKAILTLANGQQIILDSVANGVLAQQGNANVVKLSNGQLAYKGTGEKADEIIYNTLATPRGGQYRLMLPDGSKVWLNAVSSIRYPTTFTGKERIVEITGEAYFEVTSNKTKPFRVICNTAGHPEGSSEGLASKQIIEVLGTHFNVNAYNDEPNISTTLVEGSVKVSRDNHSVVIKPGEQTQLTNSGNLKVIHDANVDEAVAWRNGLFEFHDADLQSILRQIMRWYDVDVDYQGNIPDRFFTAIISRDKTLTGVLEILKLSDIEYKLEGKKLVITQ